MPLRGQFQCVPNVAIVSATNCAVVLSTIHGPGTAGVRAGIFHGLEKGVYAPPYTIGLSSMVIINDSVLFDSKNKKGRVKYGQANLCYFCYAHSRRISRCWSRRHVDPADRSTGRPTEIPSSANSPRSAAQAIARGQGHPQAKRAHLDGLGGVVASGIALDSRKEPVIKVFTLRGTFGIPQS